MCLAAKSQISNFIKEQLAQYLFEDRSLGSSKYKERKSLQVSKIHVSDKI